MDSNFYEEARKQRLEDNKKRFEDLGILKISGSLSELTPKKSLHQSRCKPKMSTMSLDMLELRRSSRTRNPISSYSEEVNIDFRHARKRSKSSSWTSYLARPLDEVKLASYEERTYAMKHAENFQSSLQSGHPSFVKSMVRSHVYSCFWLGLPNKFCKDNLPKNDLNIVLEDEKGSEYDTVYLGRKTGLSGGWRGFALDHKLDDGDALVFELIEPTRFKVYIFKAYEHTSEERGAVDVIHEKVNSKKVTQKVKVAKNSNGSGSPRLRRGDLTKVAKKDDDTQVTKSNKSTRAAKSYVSPSPKVQAKEESTKVTRNHEIETTKSNKDVKVVTDGEGQVSPEVQSDEDSSKLFRKRRVPTKLFRNKSFRQ